MVVGAGVELGAATEGSVFSRGAGDSGLRGTRAALSPGKRYQGEKCRENGEGKYSGSDWS